MTPAELPPPDVLLRACAALAKLVAAEYPERLTLTEIAGMYGTLEPSTDYCLTDEDVAAIRAVEPVLGVDWDLTAWVAEAAYGKPSPPPDEGPVPGDGPEQPLIHEHANGLPCGPDREPGLTDDGRDGRDGGPGRVGPVLDAGPDDGR